MAELQARVRHSGGWAAVPNSLIEDPALSWKAKGLWAYLHSRPDGWEVYEADLIKRAVDGRDAVRSGLAELEATGYLERRRARDGGRYTGTEYWLMLPHERADQVAMPLTDLPATENPATDNPATENPPLSNTEESNTEETNTHDRAAYARQAIHWMSVYPERDTPTIKATVIKQYIYARERGASEQELIDAAGKYRSYCASIDRIGTRYVMMPGKFLSDDVWPEWLEHEVEEPEPDVVVSADGLRFVR